MPELVIGAFGPAAASRKHAFDGTEWLAILSVTGAGAAAMASVGVYVSETDARAVATHVSATATTAATQAAHDAAQGRRKEPTKNLNSRMLRFCAADFGNFDGTKPYGAPAPASPLVGKSFKHLVSVLDSTGTVTLDLKEFVVSVVSMHASVADAFNCEYSQGGTTHNIVLGKAIIEAALVGAASPPPPRVTVAVVEVVVGTPLIKLVRALPYSKMAAAGHVDALEAVELVKAAGIALPLDDPTDAGFTVGITAALSQLTTILNRAPPRTWPDTAASRLGAELKKEAATPGGGAAASSSFTSSRHMLAEALKQLASSEAEWSLFLGKSIMVTVDSTRLAAAAASDYIKMGALDAYLKRAAATASSIHACGALGSLDSDELVAIIMFELQPAAPSVGAALSSAAKPVQVSVMQNDLTGSSDERRLRLALREDYERLDGDSAAKAELEKLHSLVANPVELAAKVRDLSDGNGLKRLVSTENDVERSLAGCDTVQVRKIAAVRNALDRRVERVVFGENYTVSETMRKALQAIRTGRFDALRLFHLIKKDDKGTVTDPLKALTSMPEQEARLAVTEAFQLLAHVICVATPTLSTSATPFLIKFQKVIVEAIADGAPMDKISKWVASIWALVTQPRRQYSFGEGGSSLAAFSLEFLKQSSDERVELERATQEARAKKAARSEVAKNGRSGANDGKNKRDRSPGDRLPNPNSKRQKKKAAKKIAAGKAEDEEDDDDDDDGADDAKHGGGVDVNGAHVLNPKANAALKTDRERKDAWAAFNLAHPKSNGKTACWDFWHPQGCTRANCKFNHA